MIFLAVSPHSALSFPMDYFLLLLSFIFVVADEGADKDTMGENGSKTAHNL